MIDVCAKKVRIVTQPLVVIVASLNSGTKQNNSNTGFEVATILLLLKEFPLVKMLGSSHLCYAVKQTIVKIFFVVKLYRFFPFILKEDINKC